jgi:putative phosphoesterase
LAAADVVIHAGDLTGDSVWEGLQGLGEVVGVHGNVDDARLRARLPARLELTFDRVRLGVVHDAGAAKGRLRRLQKAFPMADAVIFGHSHVPLLERDLTSGFQIFNPGSPTDKRRQPNFTMGWAQVSEAGISFEIVTVG